MRWGGGVLKQQKGRRSEKNHQVCEKDLRIKDPERKAAIAQKKPLSEIIDFKHEK